MKKIAWFMLVAVTLAAGVYVFRHLIRWEWHRAMFAGMAMLAGELALVGAIVVRAVRRAVEQSPPDTAVDARVLARLESTRPPSDRVFAWLKPDDGQLHVFVSILLGGGVLVSAAAWVIDKMAKATGSGGLERALARRLGALQLPKGGFVVDDAMLLAAGRDVHKPALRLLLGPEPDGER